MTLEEIKEVFGAIEVKPYRMIPRMIPIEETREALKGIPQWSSKGRTTREYQRAFLEHQSVKSARNR